MALTAPSSSQHRVAASYSRGARSRPRLLFSQSQGPVICGQGDLSKHKAAPMARPPFPASCRHSHEGWLCLRVSACLLGCDSWPSGWGQQESAGTRSMSDVGRWGRGEPRRETSTFSRAPGRPGARHRQVSLCFGKIPLLGAGGRGAGCPPQGYRVQATQGQGFTFPTRPGLARHF